MRHARPVVLALALTLAGCGSDPTTPRTSTAASGRWIDVPGMICADGSGTGIWLSEGTAPDKVLLWLSGGGSCWSGDRCPSSVPRRFSGAGVTPEVAAALLRFTILDRTLAGNPFATWTHVFVPYCTGDAHLGADVTNDYVVNGTTVTWRHHGHANLEAAVDRLALEVPRPSKVVVSGSSAGGYGALLAHELVHARWDPGHATSLDAALVDDSGPTFVGSATPPALQAAWWSAWGLGSTLGALCPPCATDLSQVWDVAHQRHPGDRLALLSTTEDLIIRGLFGVTSATPMDAATFTAGLDGLCARFAAPAFGGGGAHRAACFEIAGAKSTDHALLQFPAGYQTVGGVRLLDWLGLLATGDPAWAAAGP